MLPTLELNGLLVKIKDAEFAWFSNFRNNVKVVTGIMLAGDPGLLASKASDNNSVSWRVLVPGVYEIQALSLAPNRMFPAREKVIFNIVITPEDMRRIKLREAADRIILASKELNESVKALEALAPTKAELESTFTRAELKAMGFYGPAVPISWITVVPFPTCIGKMKGLQVKGA